MIDFEDIVTQSKTDTSVVPDGQIFNVGNPMNDFSIKELAELLLQAVSKYPGYEQVVDQVKIIPVESGNYYGKGYQDIMTRKPSVKMAKEKLDWQPQVSMEQAIQKTLDFYLKNRTPKTLAPTV